MAEAGDPEAAGELLRELQEDYPKFATELTPAGLVASGLRRKIIRLSLNRATMGESLRALERYRFTFDRDLEEVTERDLNSICWNGSRHNFARDVLDVCELAVERAEKTLDPGTVASHRDSRGLARALTGDYVGAEEDFRYFLRDENNLRSVEVLELRREWVVRLDRGENPIDEKTLRKLLLRGD